MVLGLQSDVYGIPALYDEASTVIAQRLSQISGVGQVTRGRCVPAGRAH
jgi:multidrug efflux pump